MSYCLQWRYLAEAGDPNPLPMPSTPLFYLHLADFMSAQDVEKYNGLLRYIYYLCCVVNRRTCLENL